MVMVRKSKSFDIGEEFVSKSAEETKELGEEIADNVGNREQDIAHRNGAVIFALSGNLGSGKTTFVQGLAKGLGIKQRIISPTYIILRKYELGIRNNGKKFKNFYHIDLYRLEKDIEREIINLGIEEIWSDPENIIVIEWAEKAKDIIPKNAIWIEFENLGKDRRRILVNRVN